MLVMQCLLAYRYTPGDIHFFKVINLASFCWVNDLNHDRYVDPCRLTGIHVHSEYAFSPAGDR